MYVRILPSAHSTHHKAKNSRAHGFIVYGRHHHETEALATDVLLEQQQWINDVVTSFCKGEPYVEVRVKSSIHPGSCNEETAHL